jgi:ketosteroid isomerase-like protein
MESGKATGDTARAMSEENVEVDRATFKAWNAWDMEALRNLYSPDIIMRHPDGWPEPGPSVGREAVIRQLEQIRETWDADTMELIGDFVDVGDRVAVRIVLHGEGRGPEATIEMTNVVTVRDGRIVFIEFFWDHAAALETLGLSG